MTERITEYKVEPDVEGGWFLYRKVPDGWSVISHCSNMRSVKRVIKHLSTPTKYFKFRTV